jgi:predicted DNA-binding transcriptional regulator AlpA
MNYRAQMYHGILTVEQVASRLQLKTSWVYAHADELGVYRAGK